MREKKINKMRKAVRRNRDTRKGKERKQTKKKIKENGKRLG